MKVINIFLLLAINIALALAGAVYKCKVTKTDIKSGPGSGYSYIGWLDKGDYIYATSVSNGWAKFHIGWVNTKDLTKQTSTNYNYKVTADALNFREGPGTNYNRIVLLNKGTKIVYYGRDCWNTGWGITNRGYCSMEYVAKIKPTSTTTTTTTTPISTPTGSVILKTTKYNQHNYQYVYDSDCTIDYSGCLITSVAMALNQIENKKYTPVDAAKMMSFDGYCGAIYYGSNRWYNEQGLSTKKALQNLYNSIVNKRRIAIFGSVGSAGMHFVAVYGYDGKNKNQLKASDFLIHDPGWYNTRTRLNQHIVDHEYEGTFQTIVYV